MRVLNKKIWPYSVQISNEYNIHHVDSWCETTIGDEYKSWYAYRNTYSFKNEADLLIFKITWKTYEDNKRCIIETC